MRTNMYVQFFEEEKRGLAYENEREYRKDVFGCLDILFAAHTAPTDGCRTEEGEAAGRSAGESRGKSIAGAALEQAEAHIKSRLRRTEERGEFRLRHLLQAMRFTKWERFLLILTFVSGSDERYENLLAALPGNRGSPLPTLRTAISLYNLQEPLSTEEIARAVQKKGQLFQCFLEIFPREEGNPMDFAMSLQERVFAFLYGTNEPDRSLEDIVEIYRYAGASDFPQMRQDRKEELVFALRRMLEGKEETGNVIGLYGPAGIGKKCLLQSAANTQKCNLLLVDTPRLLMATIGEIRMLFWKIMLESVLLGAVICFQGYEDIGGSNAAERQENTPQTLRFLLAHIKENYAVVIWMSREKPDFLRQYGLRVFYMELPMLTAEERDVFWREYGRDVSFHEEVDINVCSDRYILTPRDIREVLWDAGKRAACAGRGVTNSDLREAVERLEGNRFGDMAAFVPSVYTWEDLIINDAQRKQMEMICNQVIYRDIVGRDWGFYRKNPYGRGICVLLYGQPGTGKTMAAQVLANTLGLMLYRVDLSKILSKYIGETEKNITELFRRAKNTNALLFFDEADALFSKRSKVKDSHDRNANIETAHLLQKLEDYEGITVLATNLVENIDVAFKRRIRFIIHFAFPAAKVRLQLWRRILPDVLPLEEEIDIPFFAERFELSGSGIKEVLTNAAFLAAAAGRGMRNEDVVEALRLHFAKYGRTMKEEDFG